jgi:dolichol-phosphate mannosyltransferase
MVVYMRHKIAYLLRLDFVRFCIVGGTGFVVNFALLTLFTQVGGLSAFPAQLISAELGLFGNFMLHHHWTYKRHHVEKSLPALLLQFHATSWPAILGSSVMVSGGEKYLRLNNLAALAVSSAVLLGWNFAWSKFVVWRDVTPKEIEEIASEG